MSAKINIICQTVLIVICHYHSIFRPSSWTNIYYEHSVTTSFGKFGLPGHTPRSRKPDQLFTSPLHNLRQFLKKKRNSKGFQNQRTKQLASLNLFSDAWLMAQNLRLASPPAIAAPRWGGFSSDTLPRMKNASMVSTWHPVGSLLMTGHI